MRPAAPKTKHNTPVALMGQRPVCSTTLLLIRINAGGSTGRIYPGSFEPENEKKITGNMIHAREKTFIRSQVTPSRQRHFRPLINSATRKAVQGILSINKIAG